MKLSTPRKRSLGYPALLKPLWVLSFLTLGLTNCGKSAPNNDISLELEEDFPTDNLSEIPLEEKDLIELSSLGTRYYVTEATGHKLKDPNNKNIGKMEQSYNYNNTEKTFEIKSSEVINEAHFQIKSSLSQTFNSTNPYNLIKASSHREISYFNNDGVAQSESEIYSFEINCNALSCSMSGTNAKKPFQYQLSKEIYHFETLKEFLIENLVARHKYPVDKIRIRNHKVDNNGVLDSKRIHYFDHTTTDDELLSTEIARFFNPLEDIKYTLHKLRKSFLKNGFPNTLSDELKKRSPVKKDVYEALVLGQLNKQSIFTFVAPSSKKFDKAIALVKGPQRHSLANTSLQKVTHHPEYTEVELLAQKGTPNSTAPTEDELNNKSTHYIDSEWLKHLDKTVPFLRSTNEKALEILKFLSNTIRYSYTTGTLSFKELFELSKGDCSEFSKSFVLLARNYGIAARKHRGYMFYKHLELTENNEVVSAGGLHSWAQYFSLEEKGWTYADGSLRAYIENKGAYLLDFGVEGSKDIETESYDVLSNITVHFVFDEESKKNTEKLLSVPDII